MLWCSPVGWWPGEVHANLEWSHETLQHLRAVYQLPYRRPRWGTFADCTHSAPHARDDGWIREGFGWNLESERPAFCLARVYQFLRMPSALRYRERARTYLSALFIAACSDCLNKCHFFARLFKLVGGWCYYLPLNLHWYFIVDENNRYVFLASQIKFSKLEFSAGIILGENRRSGVSGTWLTFSCQVI